MARLRKLTQPLSSRNLSFLLGLQRTTLSVDFCLDAGEVPIPEKALSA